MGKSKAQKWAEIHAESISEFNRAVGGCWDEREMCFEDRRFCTVPGAQWEGVWGEQFANRPKMEANKLHLAMMRIFNEYRNNRIQVDFVPTDGKLNYKLSDFCDGLLRADEQDSQADEAYDNAFDEGCSGGFGAWRLRACYEHENDPEDDRQRIRIEPIYDADKSVFFDVGARRYDKSDATRCWLITPMDRKKFEKEFKQSPSDWPAPESGSVFDWTTPDVVYVSETYIVETTPETRVTFKNLLGEEAVHLLSELEEDEEPEEGEEPEPSLARILESTGWVETKRRKFNVRKVHKYIESGGGILEDCGYIAGEYIPIIPFFGKRFVIGGIERCLGVARHSKDVARLKNLQITKLAELSAMSGVEKPIFAPEEIAGHQGMWADDALQNYPYLLKNIYGPDGQPLPVSVREYTKAPNLPPAMAALIQLTESDMQELLGNNQQAEKMVSNISGKAVELIQSRLDMQTYIYMSNMAKSMKWSGEVWLSMAREIYEEEGREVKIVTPDGKANTAELKRMVLDPNGAQTFENDLSLAKMDVHAEVGPSSQSRRDATVRNLVGMLQGTQDPETRAVLESMILLNMDGEGLSDLRDFYRLKLVRLGAVKPTEEEAQAMQAQAQNVQPDPEALFLTASAQEASAKAQKAQADSVAALANTELTKAKTAETLSKLSIADQNHTLDLARALDEAVAVQPGIPEPIQSGGGMQYV